MEPTNQSWRSRIPSVSVELASKQNRNESSVTARVIEAGEMLRGCGRPFAGELQQPVLMDELSKI